MKARGWVKERAPVLIDRATLGPPLAYPGLRIGLLGGSFNPPHPGHQHIAKLALQRLQLDYVWMMVTPGNPIKSHDDLASLEQRLALCRMMVDHPRLVLTGFESNLNSAYSVETVAFLKRRFPGVHFVWTMGADNLANFDRWQNWRRIMCDMPVAILDRPGYRWRAMASRAAKAFAWARVPEEAAPGLALMKPPAWCYLTIPLSELSSTDIRQAFGAGQSHPAANYGPVSAVYGAGD